MEFHGRPRRELWGADEPRPASIRQQEWLPLTSTRVRTLYLAPTPARHRRMRIYGRIGLRIDARQTRAPFQVTHQCGTEFGIIWQPQLIRCFEQQTNPT